MHPLQRMYREWEVGDTLKEGKAWGPAFPQNSSLESGFPSLLRLSGLCLAQLPTPTPLSASKGSQDCYPRERLSRSFHSINSLPSQNWEHTSHQPAVGKERDKVPTAYFLPSCPPRCPYGSERSTGGTQGSLLPQFHCRKVKSSSRPLRDRLTVPAGC